MVENEAKEFMTAADFAVLMADHFKAAEKAAKERDAALRAFIKEQVGEVYGVMTDVLAASESVVKAVQDFAEKARPDAKGEDGKSVDDHVEDIKNELQRLYGKVEEVPGETADEVMDRVGTAGS